MKKRANERDGKNAKKEKKGRGEEGRHRAEKNARTRRVAYIYTRARWSIREIDGEQSIVERERERGRERIGRDDDDDDDGNVTRAHACEVECTYERTRVRERFLSKVTYK